MIHESNVAELHVERVLDGATGRVDSHYFWKGSVVPKVPIVGDHVTRMSGLALIQKDLANALSWMRKARELAVRITGHTLVSDPSVYRTLDDRDIANDIKAFFIAALVFYGKAFTEAAGRRTQMARDWLDVDFREAHDKAMRLRHNVAAHSGELRIEHAESSLLGSLRRSWPCCAVGFNHARSA